MKCAKEVMEQWKKNNDARTLKAVEAITEEIYKKVKEDSSYPDITVRFYYNSSEVINFSDSIYSGQVSRELFLTIMKSLCYEVEFRTQYIRVTPRPSC